jgi:bacteriochlorophyll 4-vinyl reductase
MSEPRIGRFLVASLHQAIGEVVPDRLSFYENWLSVTGLRDGRIGLAQLMAVFSFLRLEGDAYYAVTARAGEYAADWTVNGMPGLERRFVRMLPARFRARGALRTVRHLVRATYPGSRVIVRVEQGTASIDLRGSLFCQVRSTSPRPLCGFYVAAISRIFQRLGVPGEARIESCRAAGGGQGCLISVLEPSPDEAVASPEGGSCSDTV